MTAQGLPGSLTSLSPADATGLRLAIAQSHRAHDRGDKPYGAVLVDAHGKLLWQEGNRQVSEHDPTAHAELNLIREAARALGREALEGGTIYASGEPCAMCAAAIYWSGIARVVFGLGVAAMHRLDPSDTEPAMPGCREVLARGSRPVEVEGPHLEHEASAAF